MSILRPLFLANVRGIVTHACVTHSTGARLGGCSLTSVKVALGDGQYHDLPLPPPAGVGKSVELSTVRHDDVRGQGVQTKKQIIHCFVFCVLLCVTGTMPAFCPGLLCAIRVHCFVRCIAS